MARPMADYRIKKSPYDITDQPEDQPLDAQGVLGGVAAGARAMGSPAWNSVQIANDSGLTNIVGGVSDGVRAMGGPAPHLDTLQRMMGLRSPGQALAQVGADAIAGNPGMAGAMLPKPPAYQDTSPPMRQAIQRDSEIGRFNMPTGAKYGPGGVTPEQAAMNQERLKMEFAQQDRYNATKKIQAPLTPEQVAASRMDLARQGLDNAGQGWEDANRRVSDIQSGDYALKAGSAMIPYGSSVGRPMSDPTDEANRREMIRLAGLSPTGLDEANPAAGMRGRDLGAAVSERDRLAGVRDLNRQRIEAGGTIANHDDERIAQQQANRADAQQTEQDRLRKMYGYQREVGQYVAGAQHDIGAKRLEAEAQKANSDMLGEYARGQQYIADANKAGVQNEPGVAANVLSSERLNASGLAPLAKGIMDTISGPLAEKVKALQGGLGGRVSGSRQAAADLDSIVSGLFDDVDKIAKVDPVAHEMILRKLDNILSPVSGGNEFANSGLPSASESTYGLIPPVWAAEHLLPGGVLDNSSKQDAATAAKLNSARQRVRAELGKYNKMGG